MPLINPDPSESRVIILHGDLSKGFDFYGPFEAFEDAEEWVKIHKLEDWLIIDLKLPSMINSYED